MAPTRERHCPSCDDQRPFVQTAATELNAGPKIKLQCEACGHRTVVIDTGSSNT